MRKGAVPGAGRRIVLRRRAQGHSIEAIHIANFQAHRRLSLCLSPHVTTIVGRSDIGKSAILRALAWALLNVPRGDRFRRWGSSRVTVRIAFDGGRTLVRSRGKGNVYRLDECTFTAFGNNVPDEVRDATRVSTTNFQGQHEAAFWFSVSAGGVSAQLNQVVDLGVIDDTLSAIAARSREINSEAHVTENRLAETQEKGTRLADYETAALALEEVERLESECRALADKVEVLSSLIDDAEDTARKHSAARSALRDVSTAINLGDAAQKSAQRVSNLERLLSRAKGGSRARLRTLQRLIRAGTHWESAYNRTSTLRRILERAEECRHSHREHEQQAARLHRRIETEFPSCPLCGNETKLSR